MSNLSFRDLKFIKQPLAKCQFFFAILMSCGLNIFIIFVLMSGKYGSLLFLYSSLFFLLQLVELRVLSFMLCIDNIFSIFSKLSVLLSEYDNLYMIYSSICKCCHYTILYFSGACNSNICQTILPLHTNLFLFPQCYN